MKNTIYIIAIIALLFTACKNEKKQTTTTPTHSKEMKMDNNQHMTTDVDNETTQKSDLTAVILDSYFELKNALVEDDKKMAAMAGETMLTAFSNFEMSKLTGETHMKYMDIAESSKEHAEHIIKSDIGHQREHFESLTIDMNDLISLLGTNKTLYQDFCPMYNNNKGGMWLSEIKEIKNPYFGSRMLNCGKVQKQIN